MGYVPRLTTVKTVLLFLQLLRSAILTCFNLLKRFNTFALSTYFKIILALATTVASIINRDTARMQSLYLFMSWSALVRPPRSCPYFHIRTYYFFKNCLYLLKEFMKQHCRDLILLLCFGLILYLKGTLSRLP